MTIKVFDNRIEFDNGVTITESANGIDINGTLLALAFNTPPPKFQGENFGYTSGGAIPGTPPDSNVIDKFPFAADANATDVGNLTIARYGTAGQSSTEHGYTVGSGPATRNTIDKFPFAADGNATDVGDLTQARGGSSGQSATTNGYGYTSGGGGPSFPVEVNTIDKFPFSADANATDVGDLTETKVFVSGQSSTESGYATGGKTSFNVRTIDKFPFAADSNATDVGDLTRAIQQSTGQSSSENGYVSSGENSFPRAATNVIDKFPFAADGNATDVSDLTQARTQPAGQSSSDNGYTSGGGDPTFVGFNTIDKFPFSADGNATDVGDLTQARSSGPCGQQY